MSGKKGATSAARKPPTRKASRSTKAAKGLTKAQMVEQVAQHSGVGKSDAKAVLDALPAVICKELAAGRPGLIPGVAKASVKIRPAVGERSGINPFTKEPTVFKARPERQVVKLRPLKGMRDLAC